MKRIILRLLFVIILFAMLLGGAFFYTTYKNRSTESYGQMKAASLPVVKLKYLEGFENRLFGYTKEMDSTTMRGVITPLSQQHRITVILENTDETETVSYEVRSLDGERLVENGDISGWTENESQKSTELQFSGLVDNGNEYMLILKLTGKTHTAWYYSRIVYLEEGNTESLTGFASDFVQACVQGNTEFIVNYIQPDDTMGTEDLSYVNRHSRSSMITWKNLSPRITGDISSKLTELNDSQASVTMTYPVELTYEGRTRKCIVTDFYVVRYRDKVLYMLDFERHVKEDFSYSSMIFDGNSISVGITGEAPVKMESEDSKTDAFIYDGVMWSCSSADDNMKEIFSFRYGNDERSMYDGHRILPVRTDNNGDIYFLVYGYHNRGNHEGQVGVSLLHYIQAENLIDEILYIPVDFSEEILLKDMGALAYVNDTEDLLYFLYGNTVYSVDLSSGEKITLAAVKNAGSIFCNEDASLIGWQEGEDQEYPDTIRIVSLANGHTYEIKAEEGSYLQIQGFIKADLIYGIGRRTDAETQAGQIISKNLNTLKINHFEDDMEETGEYLAEDSYIVSTEIIGNQVNIHRADRISHEAMSDDQIFLNERSEETAGKNIFRTVSEAGFGFVRSIRLNVNPVGLVFETELPLIRDEDSSYILSLSDQVLSGRYYVYSRGGLTEVAQSLAPAIEIAYDEMGCVTDECGRYLWTRGTRALNKQLTIKEEIASGNADSLRACISIMASYEGGKPELAEAGIAKGLTPEENLEQCMEQKGRVVSLRGCRVGQLLYYINQNNPVIAVTGDLTAVLITGYDSKNITIFDPSSGETTQMLQTDADVYFMQYNYDFISYSKY